MAPAKRLNSTRPVGCNGVGRLNQSKRRLPQNSIIGSSAKNKSILYGKIVKRNSQLLRKNNIALAKALNASKQKMSEVTSLAMQYRERAHAAERQAQEFQLFRQDLQSLLDKYSGSRSMQDESSNSSQSQEPLLQISLPAKTENEGRFKGGEYSAGVKEARTQLVNPMVQGMSINKVKVRLERINDVPRFQGQSLPGELDNNLVSNQRASLQDIALRDSPSPPTEVILQEGSPHSPVDDDITVDLTMVQQLRTSGEPFSNSHRVPSLTLQRLSLQDIQRTTSAAYMTETLVEVSSTNESPRDKSASVQEGQSMFPAEGDSMSSPQSAHGMVNRERDMARGTSESPEKPEELVHQLSVEDPLEGTSWMYTTNRLSRRIRVRNRRSYQKSPKREAAKRRYTVKNLAAKDNFVCPEYRFSPPTRDEAALQDMSLTLCLPLPAIDPRVMLETVKTPPMEPHRDSVEFIVPVTDDKHASPDFHITVRRKSPTVAVTRLFDADIFRLSAAGSGLSASEEDTCTISPEATTAREKDVSDVVAVAAASDTYGADDGGADALSTLVVEDQKEKCPEILDVDGGGAAGDAAQASPGSGRKVSETVKVVLKRVDNEAEVVKPAHKRKNRNVRASKPEQAPVVRLPRRQVKKVDPGVYKEASLSRKLRR